MQPIYNRSGRVVAWQNKNTVTDLSGRTVAFLNGDNVHDTRGRHLGQFKDGYFRNKRGTASAFMQGARSGPLLPVPSVTPVPPVPGVPPVPSVPAVPSVPPVARLSWGEWEDMFTS